MTQDSNPQDELAGGPFEAFVAWKLRVMRAVLMPICVVLGIGVSGSAVYIGWLAFRSGETIETLFEVVTVLAGGFGAAVALGRFRWGAGVAMASCALAIGGGALLVEPSMASRVFGTEVEPVVMSGVTILPFMIGRVIAAVVMAITAATIVWARRPRESAWFLVRAMVLGIPVLAMVAVIALPQSRAVVQGLPALVRVAGVVVGFFVGLGLASGAGHCLIRSLEMGLLTDDEGSDRVTPRSPRAAA